MGGGALGLAAALLMAGAPPDYPAAAAAIPGAIEIAKGAPGTDPALTRAARGWLLAQMSEFARAYVDQHDRVAALPPTAPWHRAEAAWVAWLNSVLPGLDKREMDLVAASAFVRGASRGGLRYDHTAFPGFDPFLFGLRRTDAGGGITTPFGVEPSDAWVHYAGETATDRARLADALIARNDRGLTESVCLFLPASALIDVLDRVGVSESVFKVAAPALAMVAAGMTRTDVLSMFQHEWEVHPTDRGVLLYVLAIHDLRVDPWSRPDGTIWWTRFPKLFGGGATRADLAQFFTEGGPFAAPASRWLFPARAEFTSFVDLLVPRLDAWLDAPVPFSLTNDPGHGLEIVVRLVCDDHDEPGMALLRDYFARRAVAHPENDMAHFMDPWPKGACAR